MIIRCLEGAPRRFSELRVPLRRVMPKVLTASLRALERDGFVERAVYPGSLPRVEYALTPLGRGLLGPLEVACAWAGEHWEELLDAREAYGEVGRRRVG
ncbi:HxlR family transcriptional regulator [Streptomyces mobaraensis NBRC 13819 = DSM 40847]|uniref:HxlR family transcriptional regulator n=1 Tax=Streptomyces mobaraensis (strain ATCC 29032 / DSM 40847 / JCM 4168 / NBRC 13819 / NCIMB 11159 / IPCR 16-22) TaxID=1223523 RepID=M3B7S4_STRM1|nr:HxlR family transcriptional regulator [Streptomyces mobaraensis NBRC 13819 = DSM 40847]